MGWLGNDGGWSGRVVVLGGGRRVTPPPPPPEFARAEAVWAALRIGDAIPARSALAPQALAPVLDRVMILERIAPEVARVRMAGSRLHDLMGMDLRGMPFTALIEPAGRARAGAAVEAVFARPAAADLTLEGARGIGRPALSARLLLLPLAGPTGAIDRALGVMALTGAPGRPPRRFVLAHVVHRDLGAPAPAPAPGPAPAPAPGLAEPAAGWNPAPPPGAPHPRAPWLRVVDGGG